MGADASTRGKRARSRGIAWMQQIARDISERTGLDVDRELLEVREGNIGDVEPHPRLPILIEAKTQEDPSLWAALTQAAEAADGRGLFPVAVIQRRIPQSERTIRDDQGRIAGTRPNPRVAAWYHDHWREVIESLVRWGLMRPIVQVTKESRVYPRVWDGLEEAEEEAQEPIHADDAMPVSAGHRKEGPDVLLQGYHDFLWTLETAVREHVW